jgi:hypothetical protein
MAGDVLRQRKIQLQICLVNFSAQAISFCTSDKLKEPERQGDDPVLPLRQAQASGVWDAEVSMKSKWVSTLKA